MTVFIVFETYPFSAIAPVIKPLHVFGDSAVAFSYTESFAERELRKFIVAPFEVVESVDEAKRQDALAKLSPADIDLLGLKKETT